jgi:hypothetical protein
VRKIAVTLKWVDEHYIKGGRGGSDGCPFDFGREVIELRRQVQECIAEAGGILAIERSDVTLPVVVGAEVDVNALVCGAAGTIVVTHCMASCTSESRPGEAAVWICTNVCLPHSEEDGSRQPGVATEVDVEGSIHDVAEIERGRSKLRWVLEDCLGELEVAVEEDLGRCAGGIFVGAIVDE